MSVDAVIARIRSYAEHMGWPKSRLAQMAGVQDTTIRHFHREDWNPTAETLRRLESVIPQDYRPRRRRAA